MTTVPLNLSVHDLADQIATTHFHSCQQSLRYHDDINEISDDERLIKCAFVESMLRMIRHTFFRAIKFTVGSRVKL